MMTTFHDGIVDQRLDVMRMSSVKSEKCERCDANLSECLLLVMVSSLDNMTLYQDNEQPLVLIAETPDANDLPWTCIKAFSGMFSKWTDAAGTPRVIDSHATDSTMDNVIELPKKWCNPRSTICEMFGHSISRRLEPVWRVSILS